MTKVLITGGAGFIGSNLVRRCLEKGMLVDIVDDMSNGHPEFLPAGFNFFMTQDFASDSVIHRIHSAEYDVIFHLAAIPRVSYSVEHPDTTHQINVTQTVKLLEAIRNTKKQPRLVFASSSSVYGGADVLPTPETYVKNPQSPYALQKSTIEEYIKVYSKLYGLDAVSLRFFNVFGPNQLGSSPYSCAVSAWLTQVMNNRPMRSDGTGEQTRDLCYVDNTVEACILAATRSLPFIGETFNIACGERISNKEVRDYIIERFPEATYYDAPWRPGDVMNTHADIAGAYNAFGYEPKVTFWDGLNRTIEWAEKTGFLRDGVIKTTMLKGGKPNVGL